MPTPARTLPAQRLSLTAFAAAVGVSQPAVTKAISRGRLKRSVGREGGRPFIKDARLALEEWRAGGGREARPPDPPLPSSPAPAPKRPRAPQPPAEAPGEEPPALLSAPGSLVEAQLRVAIQQETKLRLANEEKEGLLVDVAQARRQAYECARTIRDALLNLPSRLAAELAAEPDATKVHARLDEEIRLALERLAEALADDGPDSGDGDHGSPDHDGPGVADAAA